MQKKNKQELADGISSTLNVLSRSRETFFFLKKYELNLKKEKRFRIYAFFVALTILGLLVLFSLLFSLHLMILDHLRNSRSAFITTSEVTKINFYIRRTANARLEDTSVVYQLLVLNLFPKGYLPPFIVQKYVLLQKMAHTNFPKILGTPNYINFANDRAALCKDNLYRSMRNLFNNRLADERKQPETIQSMLSTRHKFLDYYNFPISSRPGMPRHYTNLHQFLGYMVGRLWSGIKFIELMEPDITGKPLPLVIRLEVLIAYTKAMDDMYSSVISIFSGILLEFDQVFTDSVDRTLHELPHTFETIFWAILGLTIFLTTLFIFVSLLTAKLMSNDLIELLTAYKVIKPKEIEFQKTVYRRAMTLLELKHQSHFSLLAEFFKIEKTRGIKAFNSLRLKNLMGRISSRQLISISNAKALKFLKSAYFSSCLLLIWVSVNIGMLIWLKNRVSSNAQVQELYFDNYRRYIPVSNNYLAFVCQLLYGSQVLFNGKYSYLHEDHNSAQKYNDFSFLPALHSLLPPSDVEELSQMLYGNICEYFPQTNDFERALKHACGEFQPAQKGMASIVQYEGELIKEKIETDLASAEFQHYLEFSKTGFMVTPMAVYFYSLDTIKLRLMHDAAANLFIEKLFEVMDRYLLKVYKDTENFLWTLQLSAAGGIILILFCYYRLLAVDFGKNRKIASETLRIILPEISFQNSQLWFLIRKYYVTKKR